ncbi:MAG: CDP-alcohol phosphatidyltransferase family protein [Chlamydiae bacterium]|nr:CDP-alcohol phosphatidyltransferase family protein [Chlamydiota bacterium]
MIDSKLREIYQKHCIDPLLKFSWIERIPPNKITFTALFFGLSSAISICLQYPFLALFFLILSGFFDILDGSVARYLNRATSKGAVLDITFDRIVESSIILSLYFVEPNTRALPCLFMLTSILICITTFLVVGIFAHNQSQKSFHYSPGLMERSEAFIFFSAMIIFPNLFYFLALLFTALVFITSFIHIQQFLSSSSC